MFEKIISIRNLGVFAAQQSCTFKKFTLIYARNGLGKSTLCAMFRSLETDNADHLIGRQRLGQPEAPEVCLLIDRKQCKYEDNRWTRAFPEIIIFDNEFIANNVYTEIVEARHKRRFHHIMLGEEGVELRKKESEISTKKREIKKKTDDIKKSIQQTVPTDFDFEEFLSLQEIPNIDTMINEQEKLVKAITEEGQILCHPGIPKLSMPLLPDNLFDSLQKKFENLSLEAEETLNQHLAAHGMKSADKDWLVEGLSYISEESCPFCGQNVQGLPLIGAYRSVFNETFRSFQHSIDKMIDDIGKQFGELAISEFKHLVSQHKRELEFWNQHCEIDEQIYIISDSLTELLRYLGRAAISTLIEKKNSPHKPISCSDEFKSKYESYKNELSEITELNSNFCEINSKIEERKQQVGASGLVEETRKLDNLRVSKIRYQDCTRKLCENFTEQSKLLKKLDNEVKEVRSRLKNYSDSAVEPFADRINSLLKDFGTSFRIAKIENSFKGGEPQSEYCIEINEEQVPLGTSKTPLSKPSLRNTLSSGDRSTLAFAFFLSQLGKDPLMNQKIVIFDDPFGSMDRFRRQQTVYSIVDTSEKSKQTIVLSHDVDFLKLVFRENIINKSELITLQLSAKQKNRVIIENADFDNIDQNPADQDIEDLQNYLTNSVGNELDIIRKLRPLLETHLRKNYPNLASGSANIAGFLSNIENLNDAHPLKDQIQRIHGINNFTKIYHHGNEINRRNESIDPGELKTFVKQTLEIIGYPID